MENRRRGETEKDAERTEPKVDKELLTRAQLFNCASEYVRAGPQREARHSGPGDLAIVSIVLRERQARFLRLARGTAERAAKRAGFASGAGQRKRGRLTSLSPIVSYRGRIDFDFRRVRAAARHSFRSIGGSSKYARTGDASAEGGAWRGRDEGSKGEAVARNVFVSRGKKDKRDSRPNGS